MYSVQDTAEAVGFPIRKCVDQSLFAAPHALSQRITSFIASQRQGIHQMPLSRLIILIINAHPSRRFAWNSLNRQVNIEKDQLCARFVWQCAVKPTDLGYKQTVQALM